MNRVASAVGLRAGALGLVADGLAVRPDGPYVPGREALRSGARDRIVLGGGSRSWKVIAAPGILRSLPDVEVVDGLATDPRAS